MPMVALALGTNQGSRLATLQQAFADLATLASNLRSSPVYESAAAYVEDQPPFLNAVAIGETTLPPLELLAALKKLEATAGRRPGLRFGPRPLDLDILLYGDIMLTTPELTIPHPRMHERAFVLTPLAALLPTLRLPGAEKTIAGLANAASIGAIMRTVAPSLEDYASGS